MTQEQLSKLYSAPFAIRSKGTQGEKGTGMGYKYCQRLSHSK